MQGTAAANAIDMHGRLDTRGLAFDGNHLAGGQTEFKFVEAVAGALRAEITETPLGKFPPKACITKARRNRSASNFSSRIQEAVFFTGQPAIRKKTVH